MLRDVSDLISKPWRKKLSATDLFLWLVLFLVLAFGIQDMLRILAAWMKQAAN